MEESSSNLEAEIVGIHFSLATAKEIRTASVSGCPVSHSSQLTNPFLGLPLEYGKCEACGTLEVGQCEGHFGYIELPVPVYHPSYVMELKQMLNLLCLKCLTIRNQAVPEYVHNEIPVSTSGFSKKSSLCCKKLSKVSVREVKKPEGVLFLELRVPAKDVIDWSFLKQYGFSYGDDHTRILLPAEVMEIIKRIPDATIMKLRKKGYFPQDGYILRSLPVPPNCLYVPKISDGITVFSNDISIIMLKKVLRMVENIRKSRSGVLTFESHDAEATDLQLSVYQYLQFRGVGKPDHDKSRYGLQIDAEKYASTAWIQKIRDLFIRKGCGFSSRSVITGDAYIQVNEIGIPVEIAERIAFEEIVNVHNQDYLQKLVDDKQCLGFKEDSTLYSLKEGSKGHTSLRLGQIVLRTIKDGDVVFVNRPPTTHKHALQALRVYIHEDHTVKVNPLICSPLSADFDGDCIHLFYPQSLASRAEVLELFSLEKQLLSSHNGNLLLQLTTDSIFSLKRLLKDYNMLRHVAQDLVLHACAEFQTSFSKLDLHNNNLTVLHVLQACLPEKFDCFDGKLSIKDSVIIDIDPSRDVSSTITTILESIFLEKGASAVLLFLNSLQPLLMEYLYANGYCFGLNDFSITNEVRQKKQEMLNLVGPLLSSLRSEFNETESSLVRYYINHMEAPIVDYLLNSSNVVDLINIESSSAMKKVIQQIGFLGLQIVEKESFYSKNLVEDFSLLYESKYPCPADYLSAKFGFVGSSFFYGLDPYEAIVHSTSVREVTLRSSQGLSEPGILFKNLMAVLRDIVVCYDGTVRNISSNSIIQFEYTTNLNKEPTSLFCAGEPVGVLAATALSNPAYKAVLDSSSDSNSSWNLMKEILHCSVKFKNNLNDRCVILYLNDCGCENKYCLEKTAYTVKRFLERVKLKSVVNSFWIEYMNYNPSADIEPTSRLCGHIHMNMGMLEGLNVDLQVIQNKCEERLSLLGKRKVIGAIFKTVCIYVSDTCTYGKHDTGNPCLKFWLQGIVNDDLQRMSVILSDHIFTALSETTIKGDDKIASVNVITVNPSSTPWVRNPSKSNNSEIAVQLVLEKSFVKHRGDSWRAAINCCLPILHLIDTKRSIPYTVKDIQGLTGISSAFEQAAKRVSSSVSTVSKGVLQEHLILVANTMTCSGNMVGFNPGGYRAISRAFNLQEPFTEATLSAPKKCFERSAVKCNVDKLSSVVAACSWGKQVNVGTGSSFEILWEDNQRDLKQESVSNPYEYLNNLCSGNYDQPLSSFIDPGVNDLMGGKRDWSPFEKASFNDKDVTKMGSGNETDISWLEQAPEISTAWGANDGPPTSWNNAMSQEPLSGISSAWGSSDKESPSKNVGWGMNDRLKSPTWNASKKDGALGMNDDQKPALFNANASDEPPSRSAWNSNQDSALENIGWSMIDEPKSSSWNASMSNEPKSQISRGSSGTGSAWDSLTLSEPVFQATSALGCSANKSSMEVKRNSSAWNDSSSYDTASKWDLSGADALKNNQSSNERNTRSSNESQISNAWDSSAKETTLNSTRNSDGLNADPSTEPASHISSAWLSTPTEETLNATVNDSGWNANSFNESASHLSSAWDSKSNEIAPDHFRNSSDWSDKEERKQNQNSWPTNSSKEPSPRVSGAWESDVNQSEIPIAQISASAWGSTLHKRASEVTDSPRNVISDTNSLNETPNWTTNESITNDLPNWNANESDSAKSWSQTNDSSSSMWGSQNPPLGDWSSAKKNSEHNENWRRSQNVREPWEKRDKRKREDWKDQKNPERGVMRTETRKSLHLFTPEEQPILADVDQLVRSIRKIIHLSGYNDEDPLSEDDRSFIVDNVLNFHPQKAEKIGGGIDHLMVSRSTKFPDTRCFYVVTCEGDRNDFSYLKCMDSYLRGKYPDAAEDFIRKYFERRVGGESVADKSEP